MVISQPYRLINARPSPYGRKVAVAMLEKGVIFDTVYDEPWSDHSITAEFNPLRQLPVLITPAGQNICDSSYILDWLEITHPAPSLLPSDRADMLSALEMKTLGERLMEIAQSLIFEMHRHEPSALWINRQSAKIASGLLALDRIAAMPFARDTTVIHLGHIAVGTSLIVWEFVVAEGMSPPIEVLKWRGRHSALTAMIAALEQRPSFIATRPQSMQVDIARATN